MYKEVESIKKTNKLLNKLFEKQKDYFHFKYTFDVHKAKYTPTYIVIIRIKMFLINFVIG